jgi:hypothetical protein
VRRDRALGKRVATGAIPVPSTIIITRFIRPGSQVTPMQISHDDSERKSNPRAPVLSRHHHVRRRHDSPHREFRPKIVGPDDMATVFVGLAGGGCRTLQAVLESEVDQ